jgi:hypothetical protein
MAGLGTLLDLRVFDLHIGACWKNESNGRLQTTKLSAISVTYLFTWNSKPRAPKSASNCLVTR